MNILEKHLLVAFALALPLTLGACASDSAPSSDASSDSSSDSSTDGKSLAPSDVLARESRECLDSLSGWTEVAGEHLAATATAESAAATFQSPDMERARGEISDSCSVEARELVDAATTQVTEASTSALVCLLDPDCTQEKAAEAEDVVSRMVEKVLEIDAWGDDS